MLTIRFIYHGPRKPGSTKIYPCLDSGFFIDNEIVTEEARRAPSVNKIKEGRYIYV